MDSTQKSHSISSLQFNNLAKENLLRPDMDPEFILAWIQGKNPYEETNQRNKRKNPDLPRKNQTKLRKPKVEILNSVDLQFKGMCFLPVL